MKKLDFPCVILAGGKSSRMGEDKSLLPFGKYDSLIQYQYEKLSKIFNNVYISCKNNKFNFEANLILDENSISSPMIALEAILQKFNKKVFIISVDIPFVEENTIRTLVSKSNSYDITIAKDTNHSHNLCGVYDINTLISIDQCIQKEIHKINYLIKNSKSQEIIFDDNNQFLNINTKNDYQKALKKTIF
jgi:molybdopterin-guanine dinucleotide biosynthesis protein A